MLQLFLLNQLKTALPELVNASQNIVSKNVLAGLNTQLDVQMPKISNVDQLTDEQISNCSKLFNLAKDKLARGHVPIEKVGGEDFARAWNFTAKTDESLEKDMDIESGMGMKK